MKTIENLFNNAIEHWRVNKGVGTALIPSHIEDKYMILGVLQNLYNKSPTVSCIIVTDNFIERANIVDFLTHQNNENDDEFKKLIEDKYLRVYTQGFVEQMNTYMTPFVFIWYHVKECTDNVYSYFVSSKFRLVIINNRLGYEDTNKLYKVCPLLDDFKQENIEQIRMSTPVEEEFIPIQIPDDTEQFKLLKHYNKYIETTLNIFGDFKTLDICRTGDFGTNISAVRCCYDIARNNGWNENLDMSVEYNRQIDELYNPNHLADRAKETYEIIRNRSNLLSDYDSKLETILEIINDNPTSKILIINKRAGFAKLVTDYINNTSETTICGNYHDKVENIVARDVNNNPILYKSGAKKGQVKELGAIAQKRLNESLFNNDKLRVLSTNNAPDKDLNVSADIIIITSSQCENVENYLYRLSKLNVSNPLKVYTLYIKNSLEEKKLDERMETDTHKIVKRYEKQVLNENNLDFIVVD